ncbi:acyl-CoA thioesterase [Streptomyces sp. SID14478]|uniref:acyl-CoA thioesterase n=1 Tax=Streptomyces sp. SID14478 TaxID=2706073 RepID=UPI0013D96BD5|nr:thioesterase family protein [Streptomyces sp. SID14478]NEB76392.1 acyl-CoA thioesterase [Streptomyces sp. SID14478]
MYTHPLQLRWADVDSYGHVNNAVISSYLEEVRARLLDDLLPSEEAERRRKAFVVSQLEIAFKAPLSYRKESVSVDVWVISARGSRLQLGYAVRDVKRIYATATTVMAAFDLDEGRPRRLTDEELAFLAGYMKPEADEAQSN